MIEDVWGSVLSAAMKLPGAKVDRREFLKRELASVCDQKQLESILNGDLKVKDVLKKTQVENMTDGCISYHVSKASLISAVAGIPGGFAMLATVPVDMAQFYSHVLVLIQKLLYLHGWPELEAGGRNLDDGTKYILTMFMGVAFGSTQAAVIARKLAEHLAKEAAARIPQKMFAQYAMRSVAEQTAKWVGVQIAKSGTSKSVSKFIPLIGAPISAAFTYYMFKPMAKRLKDHLQSQW